MLCSPMQMFWTTGRQRISRDSWTKGEMFNMDFAVYNKASMGMGWICSKEKYKRRPRFWTHLQRSSGSQHFWYSDLYFVLMMSYLASMFTSMMSVLCAVFKFPVLRLIWILFQHIVYQKLLTQNLKLLELILILIATFHLCLTEIDDLKNRMQLYGRLCYVGETL